MRRTRGGSKYALSSRMSRVRSVTSLSAPPITPATATAPSASAITRSSRASARSCAVERRERLARRAPRARGRSPPRTRARSKAWSGWPSSSITRFVTSTTLLIERKPGGLEPRARATPGDGPDPDAAHARAPRSAGSRCGLRSRRARRARPPLRRASGGAVGGQPERAAEVRAHLARHAEQRDPVAAVRRDLDVEHDLAAREHARRACAHRRRRRPRTRMPPASSPRPELAGGADHAVRDDAADLRSS